MFDQSCLTCGTGGSEKPSSSSIAIGLKRNQIGRGRFLPQSRMSPRSNGLAVDGRVGFKFEIVDRAFRELGEPSLSRAGPSVGDSLYLWSGTMGLWSNREKFQSTPI
jgi:hypothetical protein